MIFVATRLQQGFVGMSQATRMCCKETGNKDLLQRYKQKEFVTKGQGARVCYKRTKNKEF